MSRAVTAPFVVAGCGRWGFDPIAGDGATGDGKSDGGKDLDTIDDAFDGSNFFHAGVEPAAHRLAQGGGRLQLQPHVRRIPQRDLEWRDAGGRGATPATAADNGVIYAETVTVRIS